MGVVLGKNLGEITPNIVKKVKKQALSISFFSYFGWEISVKAKKGVVLQVLEWKFKSNIARNSTFEGCLGPNFCPIWVKNGHKIDNNIISVFPEY